jgi:hypothetical protein
MGFVVEKSEGKKPVGRHRHRWEDNIKTVTVKKYTIFPVVN